MAKSYDIAVVKGDGIGIEVIDEAIKVLKAASARHGFSFRFREYPFGADHYLATKELFADSALSEMKQMHAILLGAIGDPRVETGILERGIVGRMRFDLDLYVNLRPIKLYSSHICPLKDKEPKDIDMIVVRENTEDVYTGVHGFFKKGTPDEVALQQMVFTRKGTERIIRHAYGIARGRKRKKLTLCDKANAIAAMDLWRRTFNEVGQEFPDVEKDYAFVDATCMWMVKNPEFFDVIVSSNMFGDIITDLGAMLQGGLGIAAGGNIHPGKVSMFEPIHGSAPKYKGSNKSNPLAAICAGAMMLEHIGEKEAAAAIEGAVIHLIVSKTLASLDARSGRTTSEIGDMVVETLAGKKVR
ncbi:MAG: 3-isopropylmalate dehydrogenase [Planctomycetes bacterium RBG_16_59_8]|nr:MAG: 3-isopropylmalate dehydrogenase [Planctomycetes bacterium RBG_16_59_8]